MLEHYSVEQGELARRRHWRLRKACDARKPIAAILEVTDTVPLRASTAG